MCHTDPTYHIDICTYTHTENPYCTRPVWVFCVCVCGLVAVVRAPLTLFTFLSVPSPYLPYTVCTLPGLSPGTAPPMKTIRRTSATVSPHTDSGKVWFPTRGPGGKPHQSALPSIPLNPVPVIPLLTVRFKVRGTRVKHHDPIKTWPIQCVEPQQPSLSPPLLVSGREGRERRGWENRGQVGLYGVVWCGVWLKKSSACTTSVMDARFLP